MRHRLILGYTGIATGAPKWTTRSSSSQIHHLWGLSQLERAPLWTLPDIQGLVSRQGSCLRFMLPAALATNQNGKHAPAQLYLLLEQSRAEITNPCHPCPSKSHTIIDPHIDRTQDTSWTNQIAPFAQVADHAVTLAGQNV